MRLAIMPTMLRQDPTNNSVEEMCVVSSLRWVAFWEEWGAKVHGVHVSCA